MVEIKRLHDWRVSPSQARDIQRRLAGEVSKISEVTSPQFIAGVDISVPRERGVATGAVVVLSYPTLKLIETRVVSGRLDFPYVPGLLSFREAPLTLAACSELSVAPDLILVDGQGVAHPRRMGLASHLGLFLDKPTVGCAKSLLCGNCEMLGEAQGSYTEIVDRGEVIGAALRTKAGIKPVYVSIGHKIDLETAIHWVLNCGRGYRLPEPTRLAHLAAGGNLAPGRYQSESGAGYQGWLWE